MLQPDRNSLHCPPLKRRPPNCDRENSPRGPHSSLVLVSRTQGLTGKVHNDFSSILSIFSSHSSLQKKKQERSQLPNSAVPWHMTPSSKIMPLDFLTRRSRSSTNLFIGFRTRWVVPQYTAISGMKVQPLSCLHWLSVASISASERTLTQSPACNRVDGAFVGEADGFVSRPINLQNRFIRPFVRFLNTRSLLGLNRLLTISFKCLLRGAGGAGDEPSATICRQRI